MQKYNRRPNQVTAVQLTEEKSYSKWGGDQIAKKGDWWVNNSGEEYSIDQDSFAATYKQVEGSTYTKVGSVWATTATENGTLDTKEGKSVYLAGDYLVANNEDGSDQYPVDAAKFESMYIVSLPLQVSPALAAAVKADNIEREAKLDRITQMRREIAEELKASHAALWSAVYAEHPTLDPKCNYQLDGTNDEIGVVILQEKPYEPDASKLKAALSAALGID